MVGFFGKKKNVKRVDCTRLDKSGKCYGKDVGDPKKLRDCRWFKPKR